MADLTISIPNLREQRDLIYAAGTQFTGILQDQFNAIGDCLDDIVDLFEAGNTTITINLTDKDD